MNVTSSLPVTQNLLTESISTDYFKLENIITSKKYIFDENYPFPTEVKLVSNQEILEEKIKYVYPSSGTLKSQNRIAVPLKIETFKNNKILSSQNYIYKDYNGLYLPEKIKSSKGDQQLEDKVIYHNYDHKGNPLQVSKANGIRIVYLWGYNYTQPVAKIENATYAEVMDVLDKQTNDDLSYLQSFTEREIQAEIQKIRTGLSKSQVTTYTHIPLVGVSTITDPRGEKITYHYDDFNRLEFVKDSQGNILKEHQYKYKN